MPVAPSLWPCPLEWSRHRRVVAPRLNLCDRRGWIGRAIDCSHTICNCSGFLSRAANSNWLAIALANARTAESLTACLGAAFVFRNAQEAAEATAGIRSGASDGKMPLCARH